MWERSDWAVSILTSDTDYQLQLPCPEYLRLKRLQNSVRISAEVIQEKLQKNHVRYKAAMVTLTYREDVEWSPRQVSGYFSFGCLKVFLCLKPTNKAGGNMA